MGIAIAPLEILILLMVYGLSGIVIFGFILLINRYISIKRICPDCGYALRKLEPNCPSCGRTFPTDS
ncbi:MAG: hypothetical protein OXD54_10545 [Candidatus Poribacteria bacterium]|nr:hypothetical protein [Candidatus Poribacteria bacterium]